MLDDSIVTRELMRAVYASGGTNESWNTHSATYSVEGARLILHPVDPGGPGLCSSAPIYRIGDGGRRLRTIGETIAGDCEDIPDVGVDPPALLYESID